MIEGMVPLKYNSLPAVEEHQRIDHTAYKEIMVAIDSKRVQVEPLYSKNE